MGFPLEMAVHLGWPYPMAAGPADNDGWLVKLDE
jgi:hypothetical protein